MRVMAIIESLLGDHKIVQRYLPLLLKSADYVREKKALPAHFEALLRFFKVFVIEFHHRREERFLFPLIASHPKLSEGGPGCTKFMGLRLMSGMNKDIFEKEQELGLQIYKAAQELSPYLQPQNPITIPVEEHAAETVLIRWMDRELEISRTSQLSCDKMAWALERYYDLLREHSQKEDECLFIMAQRILTKAQLDTANLLGAEEKEKFMVEVWPELERELLQYQSSLGR